MSITSTGLGTGLNINQIVTDLVAAERDPTLNRLAQKEVTLQAELSAVGLLKSALSDFQNKIEGLKDASTFSSRSASSSDKAIATFSAENDAVEGSYSLEVTSLATAQKLVSQNDYVVSEGTLEFTDAGGSFSVTLDSNNNATIEDVRDAINSAEDNIGVTATILIVDGNKRLVFTADETGADNELTIEGTSTSPTTTALDNYDFSGLPSTAYDETVAAADAVFSVDGQAMTSSSNTVEGVIPDATISLKDSNVGEPITLTISENNSAIKNQIQTLVDGYNELITLINEQTSYNPDTQSAGTLLGDSLVKNLENQIRGTLTNQISNSDSNYTSLASLGITTQADGTLELDSDTLDTALETDYSGVTTLFSDSELGIAVRLDSILENYLETNGTFDGRTDSINAKLDDISEERIDLNYKLQQLEARLLKQYNAMDALVYQLNQTGDWLTSTLETLPGVVRKTD